MSGSGTIQIAQPRFLEGRRDEGVLFLHGFSSYPGVMDTFALPLHKKGYWVSSPRLPGHGTTGEDFRSVSGRDWLRRAEDSLLDLSGRCGKVHILGFSLGGVLATILAARYRIESLALVAPAVINTNRLILAAPLLRLFIRRLPNTYHFEGQDPDNPEIQYLAEEYWSWKWAGPAAELLKLQGQAMRSAKKIDAPTLLMISKADTAVPLKIKPLMEKLLKDHLKKTIVLEKSAHTIPMDCEKEKAAAEVISWIEDPRRP